jgi:uncharacterized BrkB/YihY/UPF0761 family membrane protein
MRALAGLIILMFWFYLTGWLVVGGAAVAAEMRRIGEMERGISGKDLEREGPRNPI